MGVRVIHEDPDKTEFAIEIDENHRNITIQQIKYALGKFCKDFVAGYLQDKFTGEVTCTLENNRVKFIIPQRFKDYFKPFEDNIIDYMPESMQNSLDDTREKPVVHQYHSSHNRETYNAFTLFNPATGHVGLLIKLPPEYNEFAALSEKFGDKIEIYQNNGEQFAYFARAKDLQEGEIEAAFTNLTPFPSNLNTLEVFAQNNKGISENIKLAVAKHNRSPIVDPPPRPIPNVSRGNPDIERKEFPNIKYGVSDDLKVLSILGTLSDCNEFIKEIESQDSSIQYKPYYVNGHWAVAFEKLDQDKLKSLLGLLQGSTNVYPENPNLQRLNQFKSKL